MGSRDDLPMMEEIRSHARGRCVVAAGKTSLKVAAGILERATLTVSVDTALMHASVAVGTPTIGVVGPSWWPGFQDYDGLTLVREAMHCSPCLRHPTCGGKVDCMQALTPERVFAAVRQALGAARGEGSLPSELTVLP
jgi:ADP-heptose:LPS heptosyltransferase